MKMRLPILVAALAIFASCDRAPNRQAEEQRLTELREAEQRATQRESDARAAENDLERKRLADDQSALDAERRQLAEEKAAVQDDAQKLARWREQERQLAQRQAALKLEQERERDAREARDRAREEAREARQEEAERKLDFFYAALDPLGDWLEVDPYGYVWQPREARSPGWRPYTDGSWVFTEYGWTWRGDEPFGWATYHYGRWARVKRLGWVWVPGSEWAPAWVSWRRGGEYIGWAPLPPEAHSGSGFNSGVDSYYDIGPGSYNFIPVSRLGEATYRGVVVEPERNVTIVNNTVNVTKINYTTVEKKTVIFNAGPDLNQSNAASARPVPRLTLQRVGEAPRPGAGGSTVVGNVLKLVAPRIVSAPRPAAAPVKLKEKVKAPEIERGWDGGDVAAVQATRERVRQEAGKAEQQARAATPRPATPPAAKPATPMPPANPVRAHTPPPRPPMPARQPGGDSPAATPREKPAPEPVVAAPATPHRKPATPAGEPKGTPRRRPAVQPADAPATPVAPPAASPSAPMVTPSVRPRRPDSAVPPERPDAPPLRPFAPPAPGADTATPAVPADQPVLPKLPKTMPRPGEGLRPKPPGEVPSPGAEAAPATPAPRPESGAAATPGAKPGRKRPAEPQG